MKYVFLIFILPLLIISACGENNRTSQDESVDTVSLSPPEVFSITLTEDILNVDDEDLRYFLEEEIYPLVSKSEKVTIDRLSSSEYLLSYSTEGTFKGFLIKKYYNPVEDIVVFTKTDTELKN